MKGNMCDFSFYVMAFDTKNNYANYGQTLMSLSLEQAKAEFAKCCAQNPLSVYTVLGVEYTTALRELEPHGVGAVDLLRCINGHLDISDDYKRSKLLMEEKLISVNAVALLKREAARLQRVSDNATIKCARAMSELLQSEITPDEVMRVLSEKYGLERCKAIVANELMGNYGIADDDVIGYLSDSYDGAYDERFSVIASAMELKSLSRAAKHLEESLSDSESKLFRSGLVHGSTEEIRDKSSDVKTQIQHHNQFEDAGLAPDDSLSL